MADIEQETSPFVEEIEAVLHDAQMAAALMLFFGLLYGTKGWEANLSLINLLNDGAKEDLQAAMDWSQVDGADLIKQSYLGKLAYVEWSRCLKLNELLFSDFERFVHGLREDNSYQLGVIAAAMRFHKTCARTDFAEDEVGRRLRQVAARLDPVFASALGKFLLMLFGDRKRWLDLVERSPYKRYLYPLERWVKTEPDKHSVDEILRVVEKQDLFVASEKHTTEHNHEKFAVLCEALAGEIDSQWKDVGDLMFQFLRLLNGEIDSNPLLYFPKRIRNRFINLVNKQVSAGKHWHAPNLRSQMEWIDANADPFVIESGDNPERAVLEEDVETILEGIRENVSARASEAALLYFEHFLEGGKRPTQKEVAQRVSVTSRTVREDSKKIEAYLKERQKNA